MIQKFTIGLTLPIISLIWLAQSFISVYAAGRNTNYEGVLSPPVEALAAYDASAPQLMTGQQAVTTTSATTLFLPVVFRKFCASTFNYNETLYSIVRTVLV